MDAERLTPPSPTAREVEQFLFLARNDGYLYTSERCHGIADALAWVLGRAERPVTPSLTRPAQSLRGYTL